MRKEEKSEVIKSLADQLGSYTHFYLADISGMNAEQTAALRRSCFEKDVRLIVVKNTLLGKALEQTGKADAELVSVLEGSTSIMFSNTGNAPAKLIKAFRKDKGGDKPILKAAYVDECVYMGETSLDTLVNIKSREELIGDIINLLQSPAKNVISALQGSAGGKISGLVKALENRAQ
ncbi:50S ribosomal protein L10 [uncultured Rikenella sp.]|uniref:50S ribosomal protein L10 n=1 Tax=uncultured Rikenella sp. TaxID=368003 RepID=UPI00262392EA|nr:50S ribosomal protein L10 [uncultured Rikenella sp.]